jgi:amidase
MARTVKDAAAILQVIAGPDPADNYTSAIPDPDRLPDYVAACKEDSLQGIRLGVPSNVMTLSGGRRSHQVYAFNAALDTLKDAGATIVEGANFTAAAQALGSSAESQVLRADFQVNLASYFGQLTYNPNNITDLSSLRAFTRSYPLEQYPNRDTGIWDSTISQGWTNNDPKFWPAYQRSAYFGGDGGLLGAIKRNKLDAVILPTAFASSWAATIGAPVVTVPLGYYPVDAKVIKSTRNLVDSGPNIP